MFIHIHLQGASTDVLALHPHTQARANQTEEVTQGKAFFFFFLSLLSFHPFQFPSWFTLQPQKLTTMQKHSLLEGSV